MRVAVTPRVFNTRKNQWEDGPAVFHDVTAWGRLGENCAEYLAKGMLIVAEGRWESRSWEDKDGVIQETVYLVADSLGPSMKWQGARLVPREDRSS
jgi:single-strand DNA-binding protein